MRKSIALVPGAVCLALAIPLASDAAKPPKPPKPSPNQLTIAAKPAPVTFGRQSAVSGQLKGPGNGGKVVTLQQDPFPFDGKYKPLGDKTTDAQGNYGFTVQPPVNTRYKAVAKTTPPTESAVITLGVSMRVSLRLSDYTPRAGQRVKFSGSVAPQHDGRLVYIQRRTSSGRYRTVAKTTLKDAGSARSVFSRRIRVSRDTTYRAKLLADSDHATGVSRARRANVS